MKLLAENGQWSGTVLGYDYRWRRDGDLVSGATKRFYTPLDSDYGRQFGVDVAAKNIAGASAYRSGVAKKLMPKWSIGNESYIIDFVNNRSFKQGSGIGSALAFATFARNGPATFFDADGIMRTAAANELRIDHDPVTRAVRGALIEGASTNLFRYSSDFSQSVWGNATATRDRSHPAPDGSNTATLWTVNNVNSCQVFQDITLSGAQSALSIFVKAGTASSLTLRYLSFDTNVVVNFNLSIGSISSPIGLITPLLNGWFRCSIMPTMTGADLSGTVYAYLATNAGTNYSADVGNSMFVWGAQVEVGATASSYTPTMTAAVTRAADQVSLALPSGTHNLTYTFDDGSTFAAAGVAGTVTIPTTLPRRRIRSISAVPQ